MPSTLAHEELRQMLLRSADEALGGDLIMTDYEDRSNVLRLRVLEGEDLTAEEMLYECNRIRAGRRSAAPAVKKPPSRARSASTDAPPESLLDLLDQTLI